MQVKALKNHGYDGRDIQPGEIYDFNPELGDVDSFVSAGLVSVVSLDSVEVAKPAKAKK
jgi:hypothetical protein